MKYVGGKGLIATWVRDRILNVAGDITTYIEPFLGSAATFSELAPFFDRTVACDVHEDLILMWHDLVAGWMPPEHLSAKEYRSIRKMTPCALRGFAGFGCSFGSKWFGGYAREVFGNRNYCIEVAHSVLKRKRSMERTLFLNGDYMLVDPYVGPRTLVYCDPPYEGTQGYSNGSFDSNRFWTVAYSWKRRGANVIVSEESAPSDWKCIASIQRRLTLDGRNARIRTERLYVHAA